MANVIQIDRSRRFDLFTFDKPWEIVEQDERSLALTRIDLDKIQLAYMLRNAENRVKGEQRLSRAKERGLICLDAMVLQTLWENQSLIPDKWKKSINDRITRIFFDGTVIVGPARRRYTLSLSWFDDEWHWSFKWLSQSATHPSALLRS
mgnify:FL=1